MESVIEIVAAIFSISLFRYVLIAGIPFLIFYVIFSHRLENFRIQKRLAKKKDFIREVLHSLQTTFIFAIIAFIVMYTPFREYTLMYTELSSYPVWYLPVSLVVSLIIHDTYFYWMHRLMHHPKIYKHTHLLHHKSIIPSPWASYSFGIIEAVAEGLILVLSALILPMHNITVVLFTIVGFVINVYGHLGYEIAPRALRRSMLFEIINTSTHHNMHHSRFIGNYGLYFRFWDKVMGTEIKDYVQEYDRLESRRYRGIRKKNHNTAVKGVARNI